MATKYVLSVPSPFQSGPVPRWPWEVQDTVHVRTAQTGRAPGFSNRRARAGASAGNLDSVHEPGISFPSHQWCGPPLLLLPLGGCVFVEGPLLRSRNPLRDERELLRSPEARGWGNLGRGWREETGMYTTQSFSCFLLEDEL